MGSTLRALCQGAKSWLVSYPLAVDILGINVLVVRAPKCLRHPGYNVVTGLTVRTLTARPPDKRIPTYTAPSPGNQLSPGNVHLSFCIWVLRCGCSAQELAQGGDGKLGAASSQLKTFIGSRHGRGKWIGATSDTFTFQSWPASTASVPRSG